MCETEGPKWYVDKNAVPLTDVRSSFVRSLVLLENSASARTIIKNGAVALICARIATSIEPEVTCSSKKMSERIVPRL